ncbi:hypothetical protein N9O61_02575 [Octadecabacter sp.]|nr:hypothetical protein [Octadecabacter sp.]
MKNREVRARATVMQLQPREPFGAELRALVPLTTVAGDFEASDLVCSGLEQMSRHIRWLDEDYQTERFERLGARARNVVLLADQLGLRQIGQVAADVLYCLDDPENAALPATLSRLMRLMSQALEHAADPFADY